MEKRQAFHYEDHARRAERRLRASFPVHVCFNSRSTMWELWY